mmetsp:Transcript_155879/g.498203  ORF Transcript_155879/g.498203 Transcript_155879/m.498203 type:complete len:274 (-) Transcript_155879:597-1418(-)
MPAPSLASVRRFWQSIPTRQGGSPASPRRGAITSCSTGVLGQPAILAAWVSLTSWICVSTILCTFSAFAPAERRTSTSWRARLSFCCCAGSSGGVIATAHVWSCSVTRLSGRAPPRRGGVPQAWRGPCDGQQRWKWPVTSRLRSCWFPRGRTRLIFPPAVFAGRTGRRRSLRLPGGPGGQFVAICRPCAPHPHRYLAMPRPFRHPVLRIQGSCRMALRRQAADSSAEIGVGLRPTPPRCHTRGPLLVELTLCSAAGGGRCRIRISRPSAGRLR